MSLAVASRFETHAPMRTPKIGVPFLDALQVVHGLPGLIGRFLLHVDHSIRQKGLVFEFATFEEVTRVNLKHQASWGQMNPMFNPDVADIDPDQTMCLVARNASGEILATAAGKHFDSPKRSFRAIVDEGDFFSQRPVHARPPFEATISAPIAEDLRGQLSYCGGIWVHPDARGLRLAALVSRVINACMLTLWDPEYVMGFVKHEVVGSDLYHRYGYHNAQPSIVVTQGGETYYEGIFLWMTKEDATADLAHFLDVLWPQIDAAVVARS
jgi:hypothetical protein